MRRLHAYSLIEILMSLLIASIVLHGVIYALLLCKQTFLNIIDLSILLSKKQDMIQLLHTDFVTLHSDACGGKRMAASSIMRMPTILNESHAKLLFSDSDIQGDAIVVSSLQSGARLKYPCTQGLRICLSTPLKLYYADEVLISNCNLAVLRQITATHARKLSFEIDRRLPEPDSALDYIEPIVEHRYFVSKTSRFDSARQPIYALYVKIGHGVKEELMAGVKRMHIAYANRDQTRLKLAIDFQAVHKPKPFWQPYYHLVLYAKV